MPGLNYVTPLLYTSCAGPLVAGATVFEPSELNVLGVGGSATVITATGQSVTFSSLAAGDRIPVLCIRLVAATATEIFRSY